MDYLRAHVNVLNYLRICELATKRPNTFLQEVLVQVLKVSIQDIDSTGLVGKQIGEALDAKRLEVIRQCIRNDSLSKG